ncbi:MAG: hypothetical protein N2515_02075 [Deltaproteobacteria bacterium]|nr:hypothetical protein [Deltaproteobacteria bacterium]
MPLHRWQARKTCLRFELKDWLLKTSLLFCLLVSAQVQSQSDPLSQARRFYNEGEFERARVALDSALEKGGVDEVQAFALRAEIDAARGDREGMLYDVRVLAVLDPKGSFLSRRTHPDVREAFSKAVEEIRGIRITVTASRDGDQIRLEGHANSSLVEEVRIHARIDAGPWLHGTSPLLIPMRERALVSYFAEGVGLRGRVIAREGEESNPKTVAMKEVLEEMPKSTPNLPGPPIVSPTTSSTRDTGDYTPLWVGVGVGGALLVGGGVVALILLTQSSSNTQDIGLTPPGVPMGR